MDRFIAHNRHWQSPENFAEQDPNFRALKKRDLISIPDLVYELPYIIPGIYTLSGGRQIGKTTLLKHWMKYLVVEKEFIPTTIFFMTGEAIDDHHSLIRLIGEYFESSKNEKQQSHFPKHILIIDEVNYIKNWDQGIKFLADSGAFENVVVMLTGSDSTFITEARMRFPGRRGAADKADFHLHPLSFLEFIRLKHKNNILPPELLRKEFEQNYLKHGGFLTAINDFEKNKKIDIATLRTYSDWVRGDFLKRNKRESYLIEILKAVIKTYGTQVTWSSLTDHTSISHHDTVRLYVELLEAMDVLFIQNALREDTLSAAPKTAKKIIFKDPFMYHALRLWVLPHQAEDENLTPSLVESCVISQYQRFYPSFYIKNEGEVDLAYLHENQFFPIEVKWRRQIRTKDLKQISKYKKNGLILNQTIEEGELNGIPTHFLPTHLCASFIRERLQQIITEHCPEQIKIIENLLGKKGSPWKENEFIPTNSFDYALRLYKSEKYNEKVGESKFANSEFIAYLLKKKALQELDKAQENCLVLYFDNKNTPAHAGIIKSQDDMKSFYVESNWGKLNKSFLHEVWDAPRSYGDTIKYYTLPNTENIEKFFIKYCGS